MGIVKPESKTQGGVTFSEALFKIDGKRASVGAEVSFSFWYICSRSTGLFILIGHDQYSNCRTILPTSSSNQNPISDLTNFYKFLLELSKLGSSALLNSKTAQLSRHLFEPSVLQYKSLREAPFAVSAFS